MRMDAKQSVHPEVETLALVGNNHQKSQLDPNTDVMGRVGSVWKVPDATTSFKVVLKSL